MTALDLVLGLTAVAAYIVLVIFALCVLDERDHEGRP